jgi:hypothetical protein
MNRKSTLAFLIITFVLVLAMPCNAQDFFDCRTCYLTSVRATGGTDHHNIDFNGLLGTSEYTRLPRRDVYFTAKDTGVQIYSITFRGYSNGIGLQTYITSPNDSSGKFVLEPLQDIRQNGRKNTPPSDCLMGGMNRLQVIMPRGVTAFGMDIGCSVNIPDKTNIVADVYIKIAGEKNARHFPGLVFNNQPRFLGWNWGGHEIEYLQIWPHTKNSLEPNVIIDNVTYEVNRSFPAGMRDINSTLEIPHPPAAVNRLPRNPSSSPGIIREGPPDIAVPVRGSAYTFHNTTDREVELLIRRRPVDQGDGRLKESEWTERIAPHSKYNYQILEGYRWCEYVYINRGGKWKGTDNTLAFINMGVVFGCAPSGTFKIVEL